MRLDERTKAIVVPVGQRLVFSEVSAFRRAVGWCGAQSWGDKFALLVRWRPSSSGRELSLQKALQHCRRWSEQQQPAARAKSECRRQTLPDRYLPILQQEIPPSGCDEEGRPGESGGDADLFAEDPRESVAQWNHRDRSEQAEWQRCRGRQPAGRQRPGNPAGHRDWHQPGRSSRRASQSSVSAPRYSPGGGSASRTLTENCPPSG